MFGQVSGNNVLIDRLPFDSSPKTMPVDASFLKDHIQLTHDLDDTILTGVGGYLPAATEETENWGNVALIRQKRRQYIGDELLDDLEGQSVALGFGPILSLTGVYYLDSDEAQQTLAASYYRVTESVIYFKAHPPTLAKGPGTVWVDYEAGYGDAVADVPAAWKSIICHIATRKYVFREGDGGRDYEAWHRMIDGMVVLAGGSRRGY